jgi:hypothetical protein
MNTRRLLLTFALAFSLGIITAVFLLRQPPQVAAEVASTPAAAAQPKADAGNAKPPDDQDDDDDNTAWPDDAGSPEQVMFSQAQLMRDAVGRLAARTPDRANLYLIAFAGDGSENVFRNEAEYVGKLFEERFGAIGHTVLLINNPATLTQYPLASLSNLQTAVDAIAGRMDPENDVLLLFMTSHGSREHELSVALDPIPLDQIAPDDLVDLFADTKIRNKVFVISACFSGGFIDALRAPTTMVITAARTDRASFGCGTKSAITDFGRAFFANGLNDNDSFPAAFAEARKLINEWETKAGEEHSEPQIATAPPIENRLKAWRDGIHLGPPVPFAAPARGRQPGGVRTLTAAK